MSNSNTIRTAGTSLFIAGVLVIATGGCGNERTRGALNAPASHASAQASATATAEQAAPPTETAQATETADPVSPPPVPAATAATADPARQRGEEVVVPDCVGMNYQQAQNTWRAVGLIVAPAIDGKGTHRLPVIDSNWVVLSQSPAAGTTVRIGSFVTATVKKYSDD